MMMKTIKIDATAINRVIDLCLGRAHIHSNDPVLVTRQQLLDPRNEYFNLCFFSYMVYLYSHKPIPRGYKNFDEYSRALLSLISKDMPWDSNLVGHLGISEEYYPQSRGFNQFEILLGLEGAIRDAHIELMREFTRKNLDCFSSNAYSYNLNYLKELPERIAPIAHGDLKEEFPEISKKYCNDFYGRRHEFLVSRGVIWRSFLRTRFHMGPNLTAIFKPLNKTFDDDAWYGAFLAACPQSLQSSILTTKLEILLNDSIYMRTLDFVAWWAMNVSNEPLSLFQNLLSQLIIESDKTSERQKLSWVEAHEINVQLFRKLVTFMKCYDAHNPTPIAWQWALINVDS